MNGGWERLAGDRGGTVAALACTPMPDGGTIVFAATPVGIYRSTDGGRTWRLDRSIPFAEDVAVSPRYAQDETIFVCGGEAVYRSSDSGRSWSQVLSGSRMLSVACSSSEHHDALVVLVGTETDGVLRSEDGGTSWTGANAGLLDLTAMTLALSPAFAADRLAFVGTPSGLYRTRNSAQSWRGTATDYADAAVQCLAFSPDFAGDRLVLAGTETDGLLRSNDAGNTWRRTSLDTESVTAIAVAPGGMIAVATESGIALSRDAGETWTWPDLTPRAVLALSFVGETLVAGAHQSGVWRSEPGGWQPANRGLDARMVTQLVVAHDGALYTAGIDDGVRQSTDSGHTWTERNTGLEGATVFDLAIRTNDTLFVASSAGVQVSQDHAARWRSVSSKPARVIITADAHTVLAATEGGEVLRSEDEGRTWHTLFSPPGDAEVLALAVSEQTIFAATRGARETVVWRSVDGGNCWARWLVESTPREVVPLAVSPEYGIDELVYVGAGGRVLTPLRGTRESRFGEQRPIWTGAHLPGAGAVLDLAVNGRSVFAATDAGVFISSDAGNTFQRWNEGLADVPIVALAVAPRDGSVFGIGLGGTIWRRLTGHGRARTVQTSGGRE